MTILSRAQNIQITKLDKSANSRTSVCTHKLRLLNQRLIEANTKRAMYAAFPDMSHDEYIACGFIARDLCATIDAEIIDELIAEAKK